MATRAAKPTALTYTSGGQNSAPATGAINSPTTGPFVSTPLTTPSTQVPSSAGSVGIPGPYDQYRGQQIPGINSGIPQSFINAEIDKINNETRVTGSGAPAGSDVPALLAQQINTDWIVASPQQRQQYQTIDSQAQLKNTNGAAVNDILAGPQQLGNASNAFYNKYVAPPLNQIGPANAAVNASDLKAEGDVQNATNDFTNTVQGNDATRLSDTYATNNRVQDLSNQLTGAVNQTNANEAGIYNTWIPNAQATNTANSGLASNLWGATNSTNASNTQYGSQLTSLANSTNANQTAALQSLLGNVQSSNAQQNQALAQVQAQFSQLNSSDQAAYMKYLQETNPLMAQLVAQGTKPEDLANQQDVMNRYKDLSNPQVTAEERLIASQARQNFEAQDRSSREAVMAQLQGRGLQSGGLQIANMQGAGQQLSQDRMNAEMGLEANAQTRAMGALAGYGTEANTIRSADDAERNFQDVFGQNEAVRVGNLAQQRNNQSLQTNQAITNRAQAGFNDATTSINNNFARDYTGYQANTQTNQDNYGRSSDAIKTNVGINQTNLGNTQYATGVNIGVNNQNDQRLRDAGKDTITGMQTGLGNTTMAIGNQQAVAGDNWNRLDSGSGALALNNSDAGTVLGAKTTAATMPAADRQRELNNTTAQGINALGGLGTVSNIQGGLVDARTKALLAVLGIKSGNAATQVAGTGLG